MGFFKRPHLLHYVFILLALVQLTKQDDDIESVHEVIQNFSERLSLRLGQTISPYHNLEQAYKFYAAYFDRADVALSGFKKFFRHLEAKAIKNAQDMITYINKRGGQVKFAEAELKDACTFITDIHKKDHHSRVRPHICYFMLKEDSRKKSKDVTKSTSKEQEWRLKSGLHGLNEALALEKQVNYELLDVSKIAKENNDPHAKITLEIFIEDQVNNIKKVADLIRKLQVYQDEGYSLGEYLLDKELDK